jgi:SNF2 Helicase protein
LFEGERISYEETKRLINASEGLALIKNRWVAVDHEKLSQTLEAYEKARSLASRGGWSFRDALRFELNPKSFLGLAENDSSVVVTNGQWMESVIARMLQPRSHSASTDGNILQSEIAALSSMQGL